MITDLFGGNLSVGTENIIQSLNGGFSPDDESTQTTSGSQRSQVHSVDVLDFQTGDISAGVLQLITVFVVDEERTSSLGVSSVSQFTLTSAELLGVLGSDNIFVGTDSLQDGDEISGLFDMGEVINNQRQFRDGVNLVSSGHDQSGDGGGSDSRSNSMSLLSHIDSSVPSSPHLSRGEHSSLSAHVTESSLSGSVGSRSRNSGNSGNSSSGSPRLGTVLMTSLQTDSISLSGVLGDVVMHEMDDIISDGSSEHGGQRHGVQNLSRVLSVEDTEEGSGSHFLLWILCWL
mmetsp:Transcript_46732/g.53903  ORF Transcript_46732/g.53903 Transcript_46732/m.53903 type:complete len:288 (-) Transcript_46732:4-867(-)